MELRVEAGSKQLHFGGALVPPVRYSPMDTVMVRTLDLLPGWQLVSPSFCLWGLSTSLKGLSSLSLPRSSSPTVKAVFHLRHFTVRSTYSPAQHILTDTDVSPLWS